MEPFIDGIHTRSYYLGHHKHWGLNGTKLLGRKRPSLGLTSHEFRQLKRAQRRSFRRLNRHLITESTGGSSMD